MDSSESAYSPQNIKIRDISGKKFNKNNNIRFSNVTTFLPTDISELKNNNCPPFNPQKSPEDAVTSPQSSPLSPLSQLSMVHISHILLKITLNFCVISLKINKKNPFK